MRLFVLALVCGMGVVPALSQEQTKAAPASAATDYPQRSAGVFLLDSDWKALPSAMPIKTKTKRGIAASLSYGAVPAEVVSEYDSVHAQIQIHSPQPTICICRIISLPGDPVLVRLHPKKNARELDGGRMFVRPIVGSTKDVDAKQSDLLVVDVSQPQPQFWLVQPQMPLDPGEYALMLGTKNVNIFPFTVIGPSEATSASKN
jgi:hypothetical protein